MKYGILEVGSTNTKAYIYDNGNLVNLGSKYIAFKNNYKINNSLLESDIETLYDFIKELKQKTDTIYAFGTSIFRKLQETEKNNFIDRLKKDFDIDFKVVSADEEGYYTVRGVIDNIDYNKRMAVVIGGGGSTEVNIVENKQIVKKVNLDFGAMDITEDYPDLKDDIAKTSFDEILNHTLSLCNDLNDDIDALVLAGGDYIYFYETVGYKMEKNTLYEDINQPYLLDFNTLDKYDHDILNKSLNDIKAKCPGNEAWWDGARGMRFCMNAVARKVNAKYIIPTRINMLLGLINEINNK